MYRKLKQMLSIFLIVTLLGSMMPLSVSAAELPVEVQNQELSETTQQVETNEESNPVEEPQEDIQEEVPEETLEGIGEETETSDEIMEEETAQETQTYANNLPTTIPAGETYTLSEDVTMESGQWFESIEGTLDGNGHTITLTDKPLANEVTGTIQNLGVTSENFIESSDTCGSIAMNFSGTIQNCFSTAKVKLNDKTSLKEAGGLVGTATGGVIRNSYFAGTVQAPMPGFYGGLIGINNSENTQLKNSCFEDGSRSGPVSIAMKQPVKENVELKSLADLKAGKANEILNTNLPETGFSWTTPVDGSNQGFPVLTKGGTVEPQKPDKTNLKNLINSCKELTQEGYTQESWKLFSEALTEADRVMENESATLDDVTNAITKLETAKAGLKREKPTEPVAPPTDESKIQHISTEEELDAIAGSKGYCVLDNDITITGMFAPFGEFQGVLDGQGHTITISGDREYIFQHLGEEGVLQNLHFAGNITAYGVSGPIGQNLKGSIINCSSEIKGDYACGFAKRLQGGNILNSYSISEGKKGVLVNQYESGTLVNTYWQEGNVNPAQFPTEALVNSSSKSEEEMKTKEFVNLLNENKGTYGTTWGQSSTGYPYFGADQEYNPDKPNLPENKYELEFVTADGTVKGIQNQTLSVSPDEVGAFHMAGTFRLKNVPATSTISWNIAEVKPEGSLSIGADKGDLRVDAEGSAVVSATETKPDSSTETVAYVKVIAKAQVIEEIKLFIDGKDVTNGTAKVEGSEWKNIQVQAKYQGSEEFMPVHSSRFTYVPSDEKLIYNLSSSNEFKFKKPGTASMTVTANANPEIKAEVEVTSSYVPVESVKPAISGEKEIHSRNANDPDHYAFLPDYGGVVVTPENASYADNWTVTSSDPSIANYVDSMVKGYVPYKAGTVTYTAKIEQTNPKTKKTSVVTGTSEVTYKYKNPLTKITIDESNLQMENFTEQLLDLTFEGELSKDGWSVTDPQLEWSYDKTGIVKIFRKEQGYWKKGNPEWDNAPDKGSFITGDKYYVQSLKEGTVTVTGTPIDKTNKVEPIKFTITVSGGETPQVDIDALIQKGLQGAKEHFASRYPEENYQYNNNDWIVYARLRAGETISQEKLDAYYQSVADTVKKWSKKQKPTDIERVAMSLLIMNKDITEVDGVNLAEMIYNHPNLDMGSNELAWALLVMNAKEMEIPADAKWNREDIVAALLKFQNEENGGFGLTDNQTVSVDMTAMCLQALAPYKNTDVKVHNAVEAGLEYLKNTMSDTYDFGTSESTAQVLLTLTMLGIDPLNSDFGTSYSNMITCLMDNYYCETENGKGFCHDKSNKKLNEMASVQVFQAFTAYVQAKAGEKTYWDLTEENHKVTVEEVINLIEKLPAIQELKVEDEEVVQYINGLYGSLTEDEKKLVNNADKLQKAIERIEELKTLGEEVGKVTLTVMDGLKKEDKLFSLLNTTEIKGVMVQTQATIYQKDSMMSVIERTCKENGLSISIRNGEYIEAIDGLGEFDRGPGSGWVGTLNGEFTKTGFADFTVENGKLKDKDAITVEYTENLGKDVTENAELKTPGLQGGKLKENFERNRYEYTLIAEQDEVSFAPEFFNRYSMATIEVDGVTYEEQQKILVKNGMQIQLISQKNVRGTDTKTYVFHVEKSEDNTQKPGEEQKPGEQQRPVTLLVNKKYGVSLKCEGLTEDMELSVKPIGKDHEDVKRMRKEIPSKKSIFRLYEVKLLKNGKEISLPSKAVLSVPVGKEYEGKEMNLLHCVDGTVETLKGNVKDEMLSVEISSLGSIGVVIDTPAGQVGDNGNNGGNGTQNGGGSGNGSSGGKPVKTGDETQVELILLMLLISFTVVTAVGKKSARKQQ